MTQATGNVIVAPNVLMSLVTMALREVPGVARPGVVPRARASYRGDGVAIRRDGDGVYVDCYLVAQADTNLLELGMAAQATVAAVVRELAGMDVREVNIYIQDVEASNG